MVSERVKAMFEKLEDPEYRKSLKEWSDKMNKIYDKMYADPEHKVDFKNKYDEYGQLNPGYIRVPDPLEEGKDVAAAFDESKVNRGGLCRMTPRWTTS